MAQKSLLVEQAENSAPVSSPGRPAAQWSQLTTSLNEALRRHDALSSRLLAEQAGGIKERSAVEALCALLTLPARERWRARRRDWAGARLAAVDALSRIADTKAIPALVDALFDPSPLVREAAAFALTGFGTKAMRALIRALRTRTDWAPQSITLLIRTLGSLGSRRATPALLRVLEEQLPCDPARWARQTFLRPLMLVSAGFTTWWLLRLMLAPGLPGWSGYLQAILEILLNSVVPFLFFYMVLVCIVFVPHLNFSASGERDSLASAALEALTALGDRRAIPTVVELAFGGRTPLRGAACTALNSLLPRLRPQDAAQFPTQTQHQLARALEGCEPTLQVRIVQALEWVGSGQQAMEAVARVAKSGATAEVREEARRVLPTLEERARLEQAANSLLRAAHSPTQAPDELLRASEPAPATPPEELLRPQ